MLGTSSLLLSFVAMETRREYLETVKDELYCALHRSYDYPTGEDMVSQMSLRAGISFFINYLWKDMEMGSNGILILHPGLHTTDRCYDSKCDRGVVRRASLSPARAFGTSL
jgi:hypothetical protein